ncbi:TadE/TadG family type IV pilus assembly protein [Janibacter alittae]|uniref:Pilus assembly protein TadG-related protein n=1 Tax=Janibacter alittae TaxID=3115209 RepID=A0ABZ2MLE5_9MICO
MDRLTQESGSASIFVVTSAFVMIMLVGIAVDLGGKVYAQQNAQDVARHAARTAGQAIQVPEAVRGEEVVADPQAARQAAQRYLNGSDMSGRATVVDSETMHITTSDTYETKFLGIIGIEGFAVHGEAEARIVRVVDGAER